MKKEKKKRTKAFLAGIICTLALLFAGLFAAGVQVYAEEPASAGGNEQLVITVVEDIPAVDIEENEVPLAAYPNSQMRNGTRHVILMGLAFLCVLAYVLYMGRSEKKLSRLRLEAADVEYRLMQAKRREKELKE